MAVGFPAKTDFATGEVLTATNMNDITGTLNLLQSTLYPAGRNKIINGDFGIWQRGTSGFALGSAYNADRWTFYTGTPTNKAITQQTFTPGTAPVSGYEGTYFWRFAETVATVADTNNLSQRIEDVRTFAGQTVIMSFWAKSTTASTTATLRLSQNFGSGGSTSVNTDAAALNLTTSWARYSKTITLPSITGKTIGTSSYLSAQFIFSTNLIQTIDIWGVQLEAASTGSTASPFQTASGSIGGELALCQRYYYRFQPTSAATNRFGYGFAVSTTAGEIGFKFPVNMRTAPTALEQSGTASDYGVKSGATNTAFTSVPTFNTADVTEGFIGFGTAAVLSVGSGTCMRNSSTNAYLGWSAEL
jgi:hypothetical protein